MKSLSYNLKQYAFVNEKNGVKYYRSIENATKDKKPDEIEIIVGKLSVENTGKNKGKAKNIKIKDKLNGS